MTKISAVLRGGVVLLGIGLLAACQGPGGPVDLSSRRERVGGPMTSGGTGTGTGAMGMGSPSSAPARALNQTPGMFDSNKGAPL